jgi:hypothetical protein
VSASTVKIIEELNGMERIKTIININTNHYQN